MMPGVEGTVEKFDRRLGKIGHFLLWVLWGIGTLVLMIQDDYPNGFGAHIVGHGKGAGVQLFWYSYLLVGHHDLLDILLFVWLWAPLWAGLIWAYRKTLRKLSARSFRIHADAMDESPPAP